MSDTPSAPYSMLAVLIGLGFVYFQLLPLQIPAGSAVMPDLLVVLLMAWTIRRPATLPLLLVAGLLLVADLALDRPMGLWALLSLLMIEFLRGQRPAIVGRPFPVEWLTVAVVYAVALIVFALILGLTLVGQPEPGRMLQHYAVTMAAYPLVAALLHWVVRVRPPQAKDAPNRLGRVP